MRSLIGTLLLTAASAAVQTTRWTKAIGSDGLQADFISLDSDYDSILYSAEGNLVKASKIRFNPRNMMLKLDD